MSKLIFKTAAKVVKLGKSAILKGQLKDGNGRPLAGKKIVIKANGKVIKKVKTNSKGVFKLKIKPSKTTVFTALFTGDSWFKATSTRQAKVVVKKDI